MLTVDHALILQNSGPALTGGAFLVLLVRFRADAPGVLGPCWVAGSCYPHSAPEACQKNIGSAKEARMGSSYLMTIVALGALGVLIVLLVRLALLTFSTWLDQ